MMGHVVYYMLIVVFVEYRNIHLLSCDGAIRTMTQSHGPYHSATWDRRVPYDVHRTIVQEDTALWVARSLLRPDLQSLMLSIDEVDGQSS